MSRRLRVGIIVPGWTGPGSDTPALPALSDLAADLAARHDVRIVALRHPGGGGTYRDGTGVPVTPLGFGVRAGPFGRTSLLAHGVGAIRRLHRAEPFDLIHAFWADEPGAIAVLAGRALGVPVVVSVMGGELAALADVGYGAALGRGGRWSTGVGLRGASLVTAGSASLFRTVAFRVPGSPIRMVPLGVDLARFRPAAGPLTGPPNLLFVGSLTLVKDPVLLLRAFARVADPSARLVIAGDGPLRPGLERLADGLRVGGRVHFLGAVSREDLPRLYQSADALVITSRHEAQSMVAAEAAACGLPIVGTAVGVVPELAAAGGGLATPVGDVTALAATLTTILGDPERRRALGGVAGAYARRTWDRTSTSQGFLAAWEGLVRTPPSGRSGQQPRGEDL